MEDLKTGEFSYDAFVSRNPGFVSAEEQARLKAGRVFVAGVGGMGGACFATLVRAGVGHFVIADIDRFELSNFNRQVFASLDTIGLDKAASAADAARRINPQVEIEVLGAEWTGSLPDLAARHPVIVNGTDDIAATAHLYRTAKQAGATVIDAYAAPLPSVTVVRPSDPRPEERLGYPTRGKDWRTLSAEEVNGALLKEIEYVFVHSSSARHVDLDAAREVLVGRRKRMSFAPMVITTGNLMAYEALALLMGRRTGTDHRGWFFNPYAPGVEKPLPAPIAYVKQRMVRRFLARLASGA